MFTIIQIYTIKEYQSYFSLALVFLEYSKKAPFRL